MSKPRAVIVGQGYVGLPLAVCAAEAGFRVIGYDTDEQRIKRLFIGASYIEDMPSARLAPLLASGTYLPSVSPDECAGYDTAVITVPTPLRDGKPDLSHVEESATMLAGGLRPGATVILESTTYPGTTRDLVRPILEAGSGLRVGEDFFLGYSPERIDPGNGTWNLTNTPKIVSGIDSASLEAVVTFYSRFVDTTIPVRSCETAELTKLLENTFRHVNIALVNEMAMFARELDTDIWEAVEAASTKPYGYLPFTPGPGVGGHCLPIDPSYLSWRVEQQLGHSFRFVELANDINGSMPDYVVSRVVDGLAARQQDLAGSRILLLGLAYKANTSDARETPAARIAALLTEQGAEVRAADPRVIDDVHLGDCRLSEAPRVEASPEELAAADAVLLLADHSDFDYDAITRHATYVLDCRHRLRGRNPHVETL